MFKRYLVALATASLLNFSFAMGAEMQLTLGDMSTPAIINIAGPIERGDAERFQQIAGRTDYAFVFLTSPGGLVDEGLSIAAEIAQRGFTTVVSPESTCYSICAVIWVSGYKRVMGSTSKIGVHAAYRDRVEDDGTARSYESGVANADIGSFLTRVGLSREAIRYFTTAGPNEVLPITPTIAQRLDIDTAVLDGDRFITPDQRPTPSRLASQAGAYLGLSSACSDFLGLDPLFLQQQGSQQLRVGHELFGSDLFVSIVPEIGSQIKSEQARVSVKAWCINTAMALHEQGMSIGISGPSYNCARAVTTTEHVVCDRFQLWLEDRAVSSSFSVLRETSTKAEREELRRRQLIWIKQRDSCGADVQCILDRYSSWFLDLSRFKIENR